MTENISLMMEVPPTKIQDGSKVKFKQQDLGAVWINVTKDEGSKKFRLFDSEILARQHAHQNVSIIHAGLLARIVASVPLPEVRVTPDNIDEIFAQWNKVDNESRQMPLKEYIKLKLFGDKNG